MKTNSLLFSILAAGTLLVAGPAFAQPNQHGSAQKSEAAKTGQLSRVTEKDGAWATKERASYPLDVCVSSDEKLGSMGKAPEYIYRVDGKPDRLVVFCCSGCDEDFLKDPAKYLAKIDAAKAHGKSDAKPPGHAGH